MKPYLRREESGEVKRSKPYNARVSKCEGANQKEMAEKTPAAAMVWTSVSFFSISGFYFSWFGSQSLPKTKGAKHDKTCKSKLLRAFLSKKKKKKMEMVSLIWAGPPNPYIFCPIWRGVFEIIETINKKIKLPNQLEWFDFYKNRKYWDGIFDTNFFFYFLLCWTANSAHSNFTDLRSK